MTPQAPSTTHEQMVEIHVGRRRLPGILRFPRGGQGIVLFAHGSGSGRYSPRNQFVARALNEGGLATLLLDLLDEEEAEDRGKVFDIELLANRLQGAADWLAEQSEAERLRAGYFGASTGAAAALWAAAERGADIGAVVSRGGRPDLAGPRLAEVTAPALLIVGGHDTAVLDLNRSALAHLRCEKELAVVPGATHLFEEPGTLAEAAALARDWFLRYLPRPS
jgi:putative phosphoribosyl transferase